MAELTGRQGTLVACRFSAVAWPMYLLGISPPEAALYGSHCNNSLQYQVKRSVNTPQLPVWSAPSTCCCSQTASKQLNSLQNGGFDVMPSTQP